jgi:sugar lactone lactonase YvrE
MPLILEIVSLGKSARESAGGCEHCLSASRIANAFIKDQVTPMLFSKHIVSTRTLFQLTVALVFLFVAAVGAAVAANSGNPPLLVPYTMTVVAGTSQYSTASTPAIVSGYGGDIGFNGSTGYAVPFVTSGLGTSSAVIVNGATLSSPYGFAVDSVGDIYIADRGNDLIREVNYESGLINIVAGATPTSCGSAKANTLGAYGCSSAPGCADGVLASGAKIGSSLGGVAVDSFGNVYFVDTASKSVSVVYRGGTRVADFITRVNPAAVTLSNGVQVGFVYHIAGEINLGNPVDSGATCVGYASNPVTTAVVDNAPAFENTAITGATPGATLNFSSGNGAPAQISLDSAGNIYITDGTGTGTVRVINTQETPQTFFQYTVPPGYMRAILNCSTTLTTACPAIQTAYVGTGINGPANALVFLNDYQYASADAYGNVFEVNQKSASPGIYAAVAYAGGAPLTSLLTVETPQLSSIYSPTETAYPVPPADSPTPNELPLAYGNAYIVGGQPATAVLPGAFLSISAVTSEELVIRPVSWNADTFGTEWYDDNHFPEIFRIDQYSGIATGITWSDALTNSPVRDSPTGSSGAWTGVSGLSSTDKIQNLIVSSTGVTSNGNISNYNTNSPASFTNLWNCVYGTANSAWLWGPQTYDPEGDGCPGSVTRLNGAQWYTTNDGLGNLYAGDSPDEVIHEFSVGTQFPATPVGTTTPVTQEIQVHFDATNIPTTGGVGTTVTVPDGPSLGFTTTSFAIASASGDFSFDTTTQEFPLGSLLVPITGLPLGWGESALTPNFNMYPTTAMLTAGTPALPTCTQLGVAQGDQSWDCLVNVKFAPTGPGMRTGQLVATTANGSVYNFQLTGIGTGPQLAIDGGQQTTVAATGLGATSSVAVTSGGTVYIADPANNRVVVEPTPITFTGTIAYGSTTVSAVSSTTGLASGDVVAAPLGVIPTGTTISTIGSGTITLSAAATVNLTNVAITALPPPTVTIGTGLSKPMGVALDAANNVYIADTGNNRILKVNPITGAQTVLGNYLWIPGAANETAMAKEPGAAIGYTATTTNGVITYTVPGSTSTTAPPQYTFKAPQGLAVDQWGNVYVADTGNGVVVEIPSNTNLGGATPLLQFPGAPQFTAPVAVAIGPGPLVTKNGLIQNTSGFIYVADPLNPFGEVVRLPPGGGDLQPAASGAGSALNIPAGSSFPLTLLFGGTNITSPNGVAVDAAGNVYVSDGTGNAVWEAPAVGLPTKPFTLSFTGLNAPAGLALDANGNVYVADSGNKQILFMNRVNPTANFGIVPLDLGTPSGIAGTPLGCSTPGGPTACIGVLTVSNIGTLPATLIAQTATPPFLQLTGSGSAQFSVTTAGSLTTCAAGSMPTGSTCTISPLFTVPATPAAEAATLTVNNTQTVSLVANGANPEVKIVLTAAPVTSGTSPNYNVAGGTPVTITATLSQPNTVAHTIPTGSVVFNYTVDTSGNTSYVANTANPTGCGAPVASSAVTLVGGVATYTFTPAAGLDYTVSATFTPAVTDTADSVTIAQTPIVLTTAATVVESATDSNGGFVYGCSTGCTAGTSTTAPAPIVPTGSVTPALPTGVAAQWISAASQYSAVANYNIQVIFVNSNGTYACSYGSPTVYLTGSTTTVAQVKETPAPLSVLIPPYTSGGVSVPAYTTVYGAPNFNFASGMVVNGLVGTDKVSATFSTTAGGASVNSSSLAVGTYTLYAAMTGRAITAGDYTITPAQPTGTDVVTPAASIITVTPKTGTSTVTGVGAAAYIADTAAALSGDTFAISVGTLVSAGIGTPTGTVSVTDTFVPITSTVFIPNLTSGAIPTAQGPYELCSSTVTTYCTTPIIIPPCATGQTSTTAIPCNAVVTLSSGAGTFVVTNTNGTGVPPLGTHYLSFAYSGDSNFQCTVNGGPATASCPATGTVPTVLVVDNADFTMTTTTGPISVIPGTVPSGNGLPALPNQSGSNQQSTIVTIGEVESFANTVNLTCTTANPVTGTAALPWLNCFVGQLIVVNGAIQTTSTVTMPGGSTQGVAVVFDVSTPANLPLGYTARNELRTSATRTVLAFLPFGVLAFCVRRRRRLSKALWMLIAIAAVSVGMSGCGGNSVDFYTPIPTGPQFVYVTATYTNTTTPSLSVSRTLVIQANIN